MTTPSSADLPGRGSPISSAVLLTGNPKVKCTGSLSIGVGNSRIRFVAAVVAPFSAAGRRRDRKARPLMVSPSSQHHGGLKPSSADRPGSGSPQISAVMFMGRPEVKCTGNRSIGISNSRGTRSLRRSFSRNSAIRFVAAVVSPFA